MNQEFKIDISSQLLAFKEKLNRSDRIILSACFGDGKSYFLQKFAKKYAADYEFIALYPVNYAISPAEHVLEYIKRDIIFQLAQRKDYKEEKNIDWRRICENVIKTISDSGIPIISGTFKFIETLFGVSKEIITGENTCANYISSFNTAGSIYENDFYTQFIRHFLKEIRAITGKKVILVIEDLDRLSPTDLFSILNIFGSHIDRKLMINFKGDETEKNKFGFDKIISVMDLEKTKLCFEHLYGQDANFDGYIDKFQDTTPFYYSITQEVLKQVGVLLYELYGIRSTIKKEEKEEKGKKNNGEESKKVKTDSKFDKVSYDRLRALLKEKNVRELVKIAHLTRRYEWHHDFVARIKLINALNREFRLDIFTPQIHDEEDGPSLAGVCLFIQYYLAYKKFSPCQEGLRRCYYVINGHTYEAEIENMNEHTSSLTVGRIVDFGKDSVDLSSILKEQWREIVTSAIDIVNEVS